MDPYNQTPLLSSNRPTPALDPLVIPGESVELQSLDNHSQQSQHSKYQNPLPSTPFLRSPGAHHPSQAPSVFRTLWVVLALPVLSLSYLIFCFVADNKVIKVAVWNLEYSVSHINVVKAGVTSVSILVITLALLPLRSLIGDLQGEEFFRVLTLKRSGVPLSAINQVSTPSYGFSDKIGAILRRQSSGVFAGAFVAGLIAVVASTLAPATLSVQVVQMDDQVQAFRVGAIYRQSVWNGTEEGVFRARGIQTRTGYAAVLPWVENNLGATYNWKLPNDTEDGTLYSIPTPMDIPVRMSVRYVTDLIKIKPACKWHAPDLSNITDGSNITVPQHAVLPELGWNIGWSDFKFTSDEVTFSLYDLTPETVYTERVKDSQGNTVNDGSALWRLSKCVPVGGLRKCMSETLPDPTSIANVVTNDIPSTRYVDSSLNKTWAISYLVCRPNESVETREIRTDPDGRMTVQPSNRIYAKQYNIHPQQARVLMSQAILGLASGTDYAGPNPFSGLEMNGIGGAAQLQLLFGNEAAVKAPDDLQFVVKPIDELARNYGKLVQSTLKLFLDGTLAEGYVPGRTIRSVLVFTTSRPHLYVSTVVFVLLSIFVVAAHFRSPVPQFTFFSVASSLSRSEVPGIFEDIKHRDGDHLPERLAVRELRDRPIALDGHPGLSPTAIRLR